MRRVLDVVETREEGGVEEGGRDLARASPETLGEGSRVDGEALGEPGAALGSAASRLKVRPGLTNVPVSRPAARLRLKLRSGEYPKVVEAEETVSVTLSLLAPCVVRRGRAATFLATSVRSSPDLPSTPRKPLAMSFGS